jgi:hypothetical protein
MMRSMPHASDSQVQLGAEVYARGEAAALLGCPLVPQRVMLADGAHVRIDGFHRGPPATLVEINAHQGSMKGGQPNKLRADAFKLLALRAISFPGARLVLVVTCKEAESSFYRGWTRNGLDALGVEVVCVTLNPEILAGIVTAQGDRR